MNILFASFTLIPYKKFHRRALFDQTDQGRKVIFIVWNSPTFLPPFLNFINNNGLELFFNSVKEFCLQKRLMRKSVDDFWSRKNRSDDKKIYLKFFSKFIGKTSLFSFQKIWWKSKSRMSFAILIITGVFKVIQRSFFKFLDPFMIFPTLGN